MADIAAAAAQGTQTQRVVLTLRELVFTGVFAPGTRLTELSLAARLRASRTPIRHALARLAHEGLVEPFPAGGYRVRAFSIEEIWDAIEIRGVLEGTAARLAAERVSDAAELEPIRACCAALDAISPTTVDNLVRFLELNDVFHLELRTLARSAMLQRTLESVLALPFAAPGALVFGEAEAIHSKEIAELSQTHHRAIVEALAEHDGPRAESLAREHSRIARRNLARAIEDAEFFRSLPGAALIRGYKAG